MVALPAATPVTRPVVAFTEATAGLLLLQLPPAVPPVLVNVVDKPSQTDVAPLTVPAVGTAVTVRLKVAEEVAHSELTV